MSENAKKIAELEAIIRDHEKKKKIAELEAIVRDHEKKKIAELEAIVRAHKEKKITELEAIVRDHKEKKIAELQAKSAMKKKIDKIKAGIEKKNALERLPEWTEADTHVQKLERAEKIGEIEQNYEAEIAKIEGKNAKEKAEKKKVGFDHASMIRITKIGKKPAGRNLYGEDDRLREIERLCVSGLHVPRMEHMGVRQCDECGRNICKVCRPEHMRRRHPAR